MLRRYSWNTVYCRKLSDIVSCSESSAELIGVNMWWEVEDQWLQDGGLTVVRLN